REHETPRRVRRLAQDLHPLRVESRLPPAEVLEGERDARREPDRGASEAAARRLRPGEREVLAASQLRPDDDLEVREDAIVERDGEFRVVRQGAHPAEHNATESEDESPGYGTSPRRGLGSTRTEWMICPALTRTRSEATL